MENFVLILEVTMYESHEEKGPSPCGGKRQKAYVMREERGRSLVVAVEPEVV